MNKAFTLNNGVPISVSLNPALEAEHFEPQPEFDKRRILIIAGFAFLISAVVSFISRLLVNLIDLFTNIAFFGSFSFDHSSPADHSLGLFVIVIPVIGGIIVGFMALYG